MGGCDIMVITHEKDQCQLCRQFDHLAERCPLLYAKCKQRGCSGIMLLYTAIDDNGHEQSKFLKCQIDPCPGVVYMEPEKGPFGYSYTMKE
ncbi:hypothetical protein FRX31_017057 [Thalictrum thalictroides]|uniref:Uncharacterized protein n=1 Tax=Thalictrum thalictroides TaxID=46969 RepID=A0A7J6WAF3_THATH|nr:hypothetical protein FRX31_017057 [Thalictrum thalictroides]